MADIYLKRPSGETEAMLREMVPPPNPSDFDLCPCPEERPHGFQLNKGEVVLPHMSSWDLICDGTSIGPLGEPPARCEPQRGKPVDDIESLITLRDTYIQRNKVVNEAYADACQLEQSFAAMHQLWDIRGECPPLPPQAATRMCMSFVPYCRNNGTDAPSQPTNCIISSESSKKCTARMSQRILVFWTSTLVSTDCRLAARPFKLTAL